MSYFKDKSVLLIGGTGTIGQSLLQHILKQSPKVVRIFSRDEYKQFILQQKYQHHKNIRFFLGDVRDLERLKRAMKDVDYVFNCAALKHVPACEYNPFEAVQTNVVGAQNVILASLEMNVKKTVFTSTDKAIAPTNTYGASKLMAERLVSAAQLQAGGSDTVFASVRFGNVMGSRGSVIPLFKEQILKQAAINITHKDMIRYMMTIDQATQLTMKTMEMALGGEVFVLKMPKLLLIDLGKAVIEQVCKNYGLVASDIAINQIGLRPGEKMYEELMTEEESKRAIELNELYIIPSEFIIHEQYKTTFVYNELGVYQLDVDQLLTYEKVQGLIKEIID